MAQRGLAVLLLGALLFLTGCGTDIVLRNSLVSPAETAQLGAPSVFFLDKVGVPVLEDYRIGKIRAVSDAQWSWVHTKSDLSLWAEKEWENFLQRHGQSMIKSRRGCEYEIVCDIERIYVERFYSYTEHSRFAAHVVMRVNIKRISDGKVVYFNRLKNSFAMMISHHVLGKMSDEAAYNYCLSVVFQGCLEKIVLR